jgi:hypothetical protein
MPYVTDAELVEIVPDLRAMAIVETSAEVRAALTRLADRYAAMATECQSLWPALPRSRWLVNSRRGSDFDQLIV